MASPIQMALLTIAGSFSEFRGRTVLRLALASTISMLLGTGTAFVSPVHDWVSERFSGPDSITLSTGDRHGGLGLVEYHFESAGGRWRLWHAPPCLVNTRDTNCYVDLIVSQNAPIRWITALVVFCLSMIVFGAFSILHAGRSGVLSARKFAVRVINSYDGAAGRELQQVERSYEGLNSVGQSLAVPIELNLEQTPSVRRVQERAALLGQQLKEMASTTGNGKPESPEVASSLLARAASMMQSLQISDGPEIVEQPTAHCDSCPAMRLLPETVAPDRYSAKLTFPLKTKRPVAKVTVSYSTARTFAVDLATYQGRFDKSRRTDFTQWESPGDFRQVEFVIVWSPEYKVGEPWVQLSKSEADEPEIIPSRDDPRFVVGVPDAKGQKTWTLSLRDIQFGQVVRIVWPLT